MMRTNSFMAYLMNFSMSFFFDHLLVFIIVKMILKIGQRDESEAKREITLIKTLFYSR